MKRFLPAVLAFAVVSACAQDFSRSERICRWLFAAEADSVLSVCNAAMRQALTPAAVRQIPAQLQAQAGRPKEFCPWTRDLPADSLSRDRRTIRFERTALELQLVWTVQGELGGLFFAPLSEAPVPAQRDASSAASRNVDLQVENGKIYLPATLTFSANATGRVPVAILLAGSGPCDRNETLGPNRLLGDLADSLAAAGIASLRWDKRSRVYGASMAAVSGRVDYDTEVTLDAVAAIRQLRRYSEVDTSCIFIIGHSLGGMLAPRVAQKSPCAVRGLVLLAAPARPLFQLLREQLAYVGQLKGVSSAEIAKTYSEMVKPLPKEYLRFDRRYKPLSTLRQLGELPVLLIGGGHDYQVTQTDFQLWADAVSGNRRAQTLWLPQASHLLSELPEMATPETYLTRQPLLPMAARAIADFIHAASAER